MIVVQVEVIVEPGSASKVIDAVKKMETATRSRSTSPTPAWCA
jgi:hypothetical protein